MNPHLLESPQAAAVPVHGVDEAAGLGQGYGDPALSLVQSAYLNRNVLLPELQNSPLPFPVPSPNVLKKYKSVPCIFKGCQSAHPNGSAYFCRFFMSLILAAKLDLVRQHSLCKSCLRQHPAGSTCTSTITCIFCKNLDHDCNHNAAICSLSRFRFPCVDPSAVHTNQAPAITDPMCEEDFFCSYSCPNTSSEITLDTGMAQSAEPVPPGIEEIFNKLPSNYFSETKKLLNELVCKIRNKRNEEKLDRSKRPKNNIPVESVSEATSLLPLLQHPAVADENNASGPSEVDLSVLAKLEIPQYLQVSELVSLYNFIMASIPLRCDKPIQEDKREILFRRNGQFQNILGKIVLKNLLLALVLNVAKTEGETTAIKNIIDPTLASSRISSLWRTRRCSRSSPCTFACLA